MLRFRWHKRRICYTHALASTDCPYRVRLQACLITLEDSQLKHLPTKDSKSAREGIMPDVKHARGRPPITRLRIPTSTEAYDVAEDRAGWWWGTVRQLNYRRTMMTTTLMCMFDVFSKCGLKTTRLRKQRRNRLKRSYRYGLPQLLPMLKVCSPQLVVTCFIKCNPPNTVWHPS